MADMADMADVELDAQIAAEGVRGERAAERTREETVAKAQARLTALAQTASALRSRIESIDAEFDGLTETLRSTSARLTRELDAIERDAIALHEAAGARDAPAAASLVPETPPAATAPATAADVEGARLIALDMALSGDSPETIERYLRERCHLPEAGRLVQEVCATVES